MTQTTQKRIDYIDTARAFLIILVVVGHILIVLNPAYDRKVFSLAQSWIYCFHMPAFFLLHGVLYNSDKWSKISIKDWALSRAHGLLQPYILFELTGMICRFVLYHQSLSQGFINMMTVQCNIGADWFLMAMLIGDLLVYLSFKWLNRYGRFIAMVISFVAVMFDLPEVLGRGLLAYGFIMIGYELKDYFLSEKIKSALFTLSSLLISIIIALISYKWFHNDFYTMSITNPLTFIIGGISGLTFLLSLSQIFSHKWLNNLGRSTLIIMGTHQLAIYFYTALIAEYINNVYLNGCLLMFFIMFFESRIIPLCEQYIPFIFARR